MAIETWELELEVAKAEEEASVEERDGSAPLYTGREYLNAYS